MKNHSLFKDKKSIMQLAGILLSPVMLIILGFLLLLIILSVFGFVFFLTLNVFTMLGALLVIIGAIGLLKGFSFNIGFALIIIGVGLIILPSISNRISSMTLATLMPK